MPLPTTTAVSVVATRMRCTAWIAMETGSTIAAWAKVRLSGSR